MQRSVFCNICSNYNFVFNNFVQYCNWHQDMISLSKTCKLMASLIFTSENALWNNVNVCVDSKCQFGCGRVHLDENIGFHIMNLAPIQSLSVHLPYELFGNLLMLLLNRNSVKNLHLRFRTRDDSYKNDNANKSLQLILNKHGFSPNITELTICGWPVASLKLDEDETYDRLFVEATQTFFSLYGKKLVSLKFMESSPKIVFSIVRNVCSSINNLEVEGCQCVNDLINLSSSTLKSLCLRNTDVRLTGHFDLPQLERFEYSDRNSSSIYELPDHINELITSIPSGKLKELELNISSVHANCLLNAIAKTFKQLENLTIHLPDTDKSEDLPPDIESSSVKLLCKGCPNLASFEIIDGVIGFAENAFEILAEFPKLQRIKVLYDDSVILSLPTLLSKSNSIRQIILLENATELSSEWDVMEENLKKISENFPSVIITLMDCWWT